LFLWLTAVDTLPPFCPGLQIEQLFETFDISRSPLSTQEVGAIESVIPGRLSDNFDLWTSKTLTREEGQILGQEMLSINPELQEYLGVTSDSITLLEFVTIVRNLPVTGGK